MHAPAEKYQIRVHNFLLRMNEVIIFIHGTYLCQDSMVSGWSFHFCLLPLNHTYSVGKPTCLILVFRKCEHCQWNFQMHSLFVVNLLERMLMQMLSISLCNLNRIIRYLVSYIILFLPMVHSCKLNYCHYLARFHDYLYSRDFVHAGDLCGYLYLMKTDQCNSTVSPTAGIYLAAISKNWSCCLSLP